MYSRIIVFFLLIFLGVLLKKKFSVKSERLGIKNFILNISLPATIFISFISFEVNLDYIFLPFIGIAFNFFIFLLSPLLLKISGIHTNPQKSRTLLLLLSSFAPGISCFPIIEEFLGSEYLIKASLLDFGNKLFVLVFLLGFSIHLHKITQGIRKRKNKVQLKTILKNIFFEPINLVLVTSLLMLSFGFNIDQIPKVLVNFIIRLKDTLTPLVLIFIGLSIIFAKDALKEIIPLLLIRAGICLLMTSTLIHFLGVSNSSENTFYLIIALSSVSFWPFAHMAVIHKIEKNENSKKRTFDITFGLNFLAYSLPFSTILILLLISNTDKLKNFSSLFVFSLFMILIGFLIIWINSKPDDLGQNKLVKKKKKTLIYFYKMFL